MTLDEGLTRSGRVVDGYRVGWIADVTSTHFAVRWLHEPTPTWYERNDDDADADEN